MNLAVFLPLGSSLSEQKQVGQDKRFIEYYLKKYLQVFNKVYIFSYQKESYPLPKNCYLIPNKYRLHRFLYAILMPIINHQILDSVDMVRVMQLTGAIPAIISNLIFRKPFVVTYGYHYVILSRMQKQVFQPFLLNILEKISLKLALAVIVTNKLILKILIKKYSSKKLLYLPNGVDINRFKPKIQKVEVFAKNDDIKIIFVGRLEREKNLFNLIKAVSLIKRSYKIKLDFIGQGSLKGQLLNYAKQLKVNLKIISRVPYLKLPKYYQEANIFCLPSYNEGQPKVLLEAMACGLPCVVGRYDGVEEFIPSKNFLITNFQAADIAKKLNLLIASPNLRKKLGKCAKRLVRKHYDINEILDKEQKLLLNS